MGARVLAALGIATLGAACRQVDGLQGLTFDVDGGGGPTCISPGDDCDAPPPSGWSGPVALFEGPESALPSCPGGYPVVTAQGQRGANGAPAQCGACSCDASALTCSPGDLQIYDKTGCHGMVSTTMLPAGTCSAVKVTAGMAYGFAEADPQVTGSCAPSGGNANAPALSWTTYGIACTPSGPPSTCATGSVCAPLPPSPFGPRWCIWQPGAQTCPPPFPVQHVWQSADDQRGCSPCACGSPDPTSCTVTTELYTQAGCQGPTIDLGGGGQCTDATDVVSALASVSGSPSCQASGGSPTGKVVAATRLTICCPP